MYRRHGDKLVLLFLACDLAATTAVWVGAYWIRFSVWASPAGVPDLRHVLRAIPLVAILAAVAYRTCGLYEVHRLKQLPRELGVVCKASGLLFLMAITVTFYRRDLYESRLALGLFLVLNAVALTGLRRVIWQVLKRLRGRGFNRGRAVIVGSGRAARQVAQTIQHNRWTGLEAIGLVNDPCKVEPTFLPWLGQIEQLPEIVAAHDIDHVFVALPLSRYGELPRVYKALSDLLVEVQFVPDVPNSAGMKLRMLQIDNTVLLGLRQNPHYGWPRIAKRSMDLVIGTAALVLLAPLMLGLAVAVKLTSRGPVFYRQSRLGLHGRTFQMLKFRSMPVDAEADGPVWSRRNDRRCTPLGRFMRRFSLDELPQLFNVLLGDMSLVGPRPERAVFVEKFRREVPDYTQRHLVKAGMTGWAQVHGWRGATSLRRRLQCDLYYISHWSLWLDLQILCMTARQVLRPRPGTC